MLDWIYLSLPIISLDGAATIHIDRWFGRQECQYIERRGIDSKKILSLHLYLSRRKCETTSWKILNMILIFRKDIWWFVHINIVVVSVIIKACMSIYISPSPLRFFLFIGQVDKQSTVFCHIHELHSRSCEHSNTSFGIISWHAENYKLTNLNI